jgi:polyisoprenoid-binding protein YceI
MFAAIRLAAVAGLLTLVSLPPATAEPRRYAIDPDHFAIAFKVRHLGIADVLGQFLKASGSFVYDEQARTVEAIRVEIDATSVFSNHDARDGHIRSGDFLDAGRHATISFVGTRSEPTGEHTGLVHGDLTVRGVTHPAVLEVTLVGAGRYPFGSRHYAVGISATTTLKRSEFGMSYALEGGIVGDEVEVMIDFEAIRQDG